MNHELTIVCDENTAVGFALAGVAVEPVTSAGAAAAALATHASSRQPRIVVVDETLWRALAPALRGRLEQASQPVFVSLPLAAAAEEAAAHAERAVTRAATFMRRAIGRDIAVAIPATTED